MRNASIVRTTRARRTTSSSPNWRRLRIATPSGRPAKIDRSRKHKASNDDWHNPTIPTPRCQDGRTGDAPGHKAEHAVDLDTVRSWR